MRAVNEWKPPQWEQGASSQLLVTITRGKPRYRNIRHIPTHHTVTKLVQSTIQHFISALELTKILVCHFERYCLSFETESKIINGKNVFHVKCCNQHCAMLMAWHLIAGTEETKFGSAYHHICTLEFSVLVTMHLYPETAPLFSFTAPSN